MIIFLLIHVGFLFYDRVININQNRNDFIEDTQSSNDDIHEKKVPPVINKYQNPNTFNSPFYLIQNEVRCNCNIPYKQYHSIISENTVYFIIPIYLFSSFIT